MATKPKILTRDQFLAPSVKMEEYVIPELGGAVRLRSLTRQEQKDIARKALVDNQTDEELLDALLIITAVEEPALTADDVGAIRNQQAGVVSRLIVKINELSGFGRAAIDAAKANFRQEQE